MKITKHSSIKANNDCIFLTFIFFYSLYYFSRKYNIIIRQNIATQNRDCKIKFFIESGLHNCFPMKIPIVVNRNKSHHGIISVLQQLER